MLTGTGRTHRLSAQYDAINGSDNALHRQVRAAVESVRSNGFINYYGLQRFGSGDNATHLCVAHVASLSRWHSWVPTQMHH